jgi:hypothetical protein
MNYLTLFIVFLFCAILYSGCATIITGTSDRITFESKPDGARVFVDGLDEGTTPTTVRVKRTVQRTDVSLRLEGFRTETIRLRKEFNFWSLLNLADPVGWLVDIASGSILTYRPKGYFIEMEIKKP